MKKLFFFVFLLISNFSIAQQTSDSNKTASQDTSKNASSNFILPAYTNTILDAENLFSNAELEQLNQLIDSIYIATKLKFQMAFVTPNYYQSDATKYEDFVNSLTEKWKIDENIARVLLIVSMQQRQAQVKMSGNKLTRNVRKGLNAFKEKRAFTVLEKEDMANFANNLNGVVVESHFGMNLKAKNYVQAVKEFISVVVNKSNLFFDLD
jgi:TPM domain